MIIRDWRHITAKNVNNKVVGFAARVGRVWIGNCVNNSNDEEDNIRGVYHVMSLSACMDTDDPHLYGPFPRSLLYNSSICDAYIKAGGKFKDFFRVTANF
jgi:hypothetical protein